MGDGGMGPFFLVTHIIGAVFFGGVDFLWRFDARLGACVSCSALLYSAPAYWYGR